MPPPIAARSHRLRFLGLVWLALSLVLCAFALDVWPPLAGDPIGMVPPMVTYARSRELRNPIWLDIGRFDPSGAKRMTNHGFLYPILVGLLAPSPDYPGVVRAMFLLDVLTLGACAWLFFLVSASPSPPGAHLELLLAGALVGTATLLVGLLGRPDPFATLIVSAGGAAVLETRQSHRWLPAGLAIGVLAASHPVAAILSGVVFLFFCGFSLDTRSAARAIGLAAVVASASFACLLPLYPYPLADWLAGLRLVSVPAVVEDYGARFWTGELFYYWFLVPRATGFGLPYIAAVPALIAIWRYQPSARRSLPVVAVGTSLLAAGAWLFVFRNHARSYNAQLFVPLVFAVLLRASTLRGLSERGARLRIGSWVLTGLVVVTGTGFLRAACMFREHITDGSGYVDARGRFERLRAGLRPPIGMTTSLFLLTEDYRGLRQSSTSLCSARDDAFFVGQAYSGLTEPPRCPGYQLAFDGFVRARPSILGLPLGNVVMSWGLALYVRQAATRGEPGPRTSGQTMVDERPPAQT